MPALRAGDVMASLTDEFAVNSKETRWHRGIIPALGIGIPYSKGFFIGCLEKWRKQR